MKFIRNERKYLEKRLIEYGYWFRENVKPNNNIKYKAQEYLDKYFKK